MTRPPLTMAQKRTCNRHHDCDAADEKARRWADELCKPKDHPWRKGAAHCHDDKCDDCLGQ